MKNILIMPTLVLLLNSCVSTKAYEALQADNKQLAEKAASADSLRQATEASENRLRQLEAELRQTTRELEASLVSSNNLANNFNQLKEEYDKLVTQNQSELRTSSYEKISLQDQLIALKADMDQKQAQVNQLEKELYEKERQFSSIVGGYDQMENSLQARDQKIRELEAQLALQKQEMAALRSGLSELFRSISSTDLEIAEKEGRLYVSLSQKLLFKKGSTNIDNEGKRAIQQLGAILNRYPDIAITVEGHTDTDGTAERNWDLSVTRATAVVKELTKAGVDPRRITAAGRSFFDPVAPNNSEANKARNRRTAIVLSPQWSKVVNLLNQP